jgi:purine-cytosine permease-like protein
VGGIFQEGFGNTFDSWLLKLLIRFAPWFAIVVVDFFVIHPGHYSASELSP